MSYYYLPFFLVFIPFNVLHLLPQKPFQTQQDDKSSQRMPNWHKIAKQTNINQITVFKNNYL
ncbi:MAG: hypothetical protein Q3X12_06200, partial [Hallella sp.]|nr:hypothetical protein [Hallella sp.]